MIAEKFKEYEDKIAVGFVGEGSERFGFDDIYSRDHDFGPGFSMWVTKSTYDLIGEKLQEEYEKLPKEYMGIKRMDTEMAKGRLGVCLIGDFYEKYTGYRQSPEKVSQWITERFLKIMREFLQIYEITSEVSRRKQESLS